MQTLNIKKMLDIAETVAKSAAKKLLQKVESLKQVDCDFSRDVKVKADKFLDEIIRKQLEQKTDFPIISEETVDSQKMGDGYQWIVDPLDGTTNFVHNYPAFAVSIGVFHKNKPIVGIVLELPANRLFSAVEGQGAACNGDSIRVSEVTALNNALLVTGFGYEHGEKWKENMRLFQKLTDVTQGVRRLGAASVDLCHVALGIVDGFWEFDLHPWDTASGILILVEAGGKVTGMDGKPFSIYDDNILATNGSLHPTLEAYTADSIRTLT